MIIRNSTKMNPNRKRNFLFGTLIILLISLGFSANSIYNSYVRSTDKYGVEFDVERKAKGIPELGSTWEMQTTDQVDFKFNWRPKRISGRHLFKELEFGFFGPKTEKDVYGSADVNTVCYSLYDYSSSKFSYFKEFQTPGVNPSSKALVTAEISKNDFLQLISDSTIIK